MQQNLSATAPVNAEDDSAAMAIDLRAVLRALWRGKFIIALTTILALALAIAYLSSRTSTYQASASVLISRGSEQPLDIRRTDGPLNEAVVASHINFITSNRVLGRVVDDLQLLESPVFVPRLRPKSDGFNFSFNTVKFALGDLLAPIVGPIPYLTRRTVRLSEEEQAQRDRRVAIGILGGRLSANQIGPSYVIRVTAEAASPRLAADLSNAVVNAYIAEQQDSRLSASTSVTRWLSEQIDELEAMVRQSTDALDALRVESGLPQEGAIEASTAQVERLRASVAEVRADREALAGELAALGNGGSAQAAALNAQLSALASREAALAASYAQAETELARLVRQRAEFTQLERQALADQKLYERFLDEANVIGALETYQQADARIIADALRPLRPSNPSAKIILALATILGVGVGVGIVALIELLRTTFRTREELVLATGRPVVGVVPRWNARLSPRRLVAQLYDRPMSDLAESVRSMRARILQRWPSDKSAVILMSSASAREGKSSLSLLLAASVADTGRRVLIIDCDMRRSRLAAGLKLKPKVGLMDVLTGGADWRHALVRLEEDDITILPANPRPKRPEVTPLDLLSSAQMTALVETAREFYDVIILDTPPVLPVSDAAVVARTADMVLFVVRWGYTSRAALADALKVLHSFGAPVDGLVLNRTDQRVEAQHRAIPSYAYKYQG